MRSYLSFAGLVDAVVVLAAHVECPVRLEVLALRISAGDWPRAWASGSRSHRSGADAGEACAAEGFPRSP